MAIKEQALAIWQSNNCSRCVFADTKKVGSGEPCCTRANGPDPLGAICLARRDSKKEAETMYLSYQELEKALIEARANIHVLEATTEAEVAYKRWKELEHIAHKQAQQIKYSTLSVKVEPLKEVRSCHPR